MNQATLLLRRLRQMDPRNNREGLRRIVDTVAQRVLDRQRALIAVETGMAKRALGIRRTEYPRRGLFFAAVGVRRGMGAYVRIVQRPGVLPAGQDERGRWVYRVPSRYAHLIEHGHRIVPRGQRGSRDNTLPRVPGKPYVGPSIAEMQNVLRDLTRQYLLRLVNVQ